MCVCVYVCIYVCLYMYIYPEPDPDPEPRSPTRSRRFGCSSAGLTRTIVWVVAAHALPEIFQDLLRAAAALLRVRA
jgi:hypothetical protein